MNERLIDQCTKTLYLDLNLKLNTIYGSDSHEGGNNFYYWDVKLRMSLALKAIDLDNNYMDPKKNELKDCHLIYYKFSDLWYAYEAFLMNINQFFLEKIKKEKFKCSNNLISSNPEIHREIIQKRNCFLEEINNNFECSDDKLKLIKYLEYCHEKACGRQKTVLNTIINKIKNNLDRIDLTEEEVIRIGYSIRNNFVHNGETTVTTPPLDYLKKGKLLEELFKFVLFRLLILANHYLKNKIENDLLERNPIT